MAAGTSPTNGNTTKLYVIGDSISLGMQSHLAALLSQKGWSLYRTCLSLQLLFRLPLRLSINSGMVLSSLLFVVLRCR